MIKHIVLWKLNKEALGKSKEENALLLKEKLESMTGKVEGIIKMEVGIDFSKENESADVVLNSEFQDEKSLHEYAIHPDHVKIKEWLREVRSERRVIDYKI